jgi:hypothetical protein
MATKQEIILATLANIVNEYDPTVDTGPGPVRSMLLSPATRLIEYIEDAVSAVIERYDLSQLSQITDEATLIDIANRYGVVRNVAGIASGVVTVVLDASFPVVIPAGTLITSQGGDYVTPTSYVFRTSFSSVINSNDRLLIQNADGTYSANITVNAVQPGSVANLTRGQTLTLADAIPHVIDLYAAQDFTGGEDLDTGSSLLEKISNSLVKPGTESAFSIKSLIQHSTAFPATVAVSVVGAVDQELRRDKLNALGVGGGMADVYVRTRKGPSTIQITKTATLVSEINGIKTWKVKISKDDFPGWWDIVEIISANNQQADLISETRYVELSPEQGQLTPYIPDPSFGIYSAFQVADVVVETSDAVVSDSFVLSLRGMPDIANIQRLLGSRDFRAVGGDLLVKAPIPCFVSINIEIEQTSTSAVIPADVDFITKVVDTVNSTGFIGKLYASNIAEAIAGFGYTVTKVTMLGTTYLSDGSQRKSVSEFFIEAPVVYPAQTSWRTVIFVTSPDQVSITKRTPNAANLL